MNTFFKQLSETGVKRVSLEIIYDGDNVSVVLTPKTNAKDDALNLLKPILLKGSIEEMDQEFFNQTLKPLEVTASFVSNIENYEKQLEDVKKKTKMEKDKIDAAKKEADNKKAKLEKAFKNLDAITSSEGYDPKKEKAKVEKALEAIFAIDPDNKKATEFKTQFVKDSTVVSLFDENEEIL